VADPTPAEGPAAGPARLIREISWGSVPGETIVVVGGDGDLSEGRVSHQRLAGSPPRELVKIAGITAPYRDSEIAVGTRELARIRTGYHPETRELYVVLDLPAAGFGIDRLEHQPAGLRVYLRARSAG
jgi:hypothetical protein